VKRVQFESAEAAQARRLRQVRAAYESPRRKAVLATAVENLATIEAGKGNARLAVHFAIKEYNAVRRAGSQRGKGGGAKLHELAEIGKSQVLDFTRAIWAREVAAGHSEPNKDFLLDELCGKDDVCPFKGAKGKFLSRESCRALITLAKLREWYASK
jgi:hypothetical protein